MSYRNLSCALVSLYALLPLAGCAGKKPAVSPVAQPPAVLPAAAPSTPVEPLVADARPGPLDGDLIAANEHADRTGLLGDVYFDYDEADLGADARTRLEANARFLREHPQFEVVIEGHCDERGTGEYNLALGERRAQAALEFVVALSLERSRLRSISFGEERPLCQDPAETCWQRNRRAHFVLVGRRALG